MMPERMNEILSSAHHKRALLYYRAQNAGWMWLGLAAFVSMVNWFLDPQTAAQKSAIGRQLSGPWDDWWTLFTGLGGVLIVYGVWNFRIRVEIIGQIILSCAIMVNFVALLGVFGLTSSSIILAGVFVASGWRAWFLWKLANWADFS